MIDSELSNWVPASDEVPRLREITIADLIDEAVAENPDGEALVYSAYGPDINLRLTYRELGEEVRRIAAAIIGSGLAPGAKVLVYAANLPQFPLLQLACAYANVVLVPINPLYRRDELAFVLDLIDPQLAFVQTADRQIQLGAIYAEGADESANDAPRIALGAPPNDASISWDDWLAEGAAKVDPAAVAARRAAVRPEDLSQIQFTSGTTGRPKGVELSNWILANQGIQMATRAGLAPADRHVNPMPMFHCGGCVVGALAVLAAKATHMPIVSFDPAAICATIESEGATGLASVPTMLLAIEAERERTDAHLDSLRIVVTGGSLVPPKIGRGWMERYGLTLVITYGQTEFGPLATVTSALDPPERQRETVGRPIPHVELQVVEPGTATLVPLGEEGELRYRGYVMSGYHRDPEATAKAVDPEGWLASGDLGRLDAEGYVTITGRAKEMIIRGGENISPASVEETVRGLPGIVDVCVVGIDDEKLGEELCAAIRLEEGAALDVMTMRQALLPHVARFRVPRYLAIVDEYPLSPSGKIRRFQLRADLEADGARLEDSRALATPTGAEDGR